MHKTLRYHCKTLRIRCQFQRGRNVILSEILDITPKFLGDIESGSRGMSNNTLVKIANFFSVTTDFILFSDAAIYDDFIFIDLIHHCPASKRKYLKNIIEQFIESANS